MNLFVRILNKIDTIFNLFLEMPWLLKTLVLTTTLVLAVPLGYLFTARGYSNEPFASLFFKELFIVNNLLLMTHIAAAVPAIVFGPFMLDANTRKKHPAMHRKLGKWYVMGCIISAITVIPLAINNTPGTIAAWGFTPMGIIWFIVTYFAYTAAINKDFIAHRRWIMRSYAMTFAFVHVNFTYKLLLPYGEISMNTAKVFQSMISWQVNLLAVEIYLASTSFKGRFVGWSGVRKNLSGFAPADKFYLHFKRP